MTGDLHLEVHPCAIMEIYVDPVPAKARREGALYPDGAHITDLKQVRKLSYGMQRPGIAPKVSGKTFYRLQKVLTLSKLVYPHVWYVGFSLLHNPTKP